MNAKSVAAWAELDQIEANILEGVKMEGGHATLAVNLKAAFSMPVGMRRSLLVYAITRFSLILDDEARELEETRHDTDS